MDEGVRLRVYKSMLWYDFTLTPVIVVGGYKAIVFKCRFLHFGFTFSRNDELVMA